MDVEADGAGRVGSVRSARHVRHNRVGICVSGRRLPLLSTLGKAFVGRFQRGLVGVCGRWRVRGVGECGRELMWAYSILASRE